MSVTIIDSESIILQGQHLQESGMYECDQCGKTVWSKRALGAHRRLKHMNSRLGFRCRLCGLRFANKDERYGNSPIVSNVL